MTRRCTRGLGSVGLLLLLLLAATHPGYAGTPIGQDAVGVFRPTDGTFYLDATGNGAWDGCAIDRCLALGLSGDIPVVGDWTGTGASAVGVFRPSDGTVYLDYNGNGLWDGCSTDRCLQIGLAGDIPLVGDWNGNGTSKVGLFRPSDGTFYLDYNGSGTWDGCGTDRCLSIGLAGDIPLVGDWSGSGTSKVGAFRPSDGTFYLDYNGNGTWDGCTTDRCLQIGMLGDLPLVGDWNGSGTSKVGVFRPSAGTFYLDDNGNGTWDGCETDRCLPFGGDPTDVPLVGDWTGSGPTRIGVYRRATGVWYLDTNGNGTWDGCATDRCVPLGGEATDRPLIIRVTTVPPKVTALVPSDHSLATGTAGTLTVTIAPAQTTATVVPVSVNAPAVLSVPTSVTVPGNTRTAAVPTTALAEGVAVVTAGPVNGASQTATVTVTPPVLASLTLTPATPTIGVGQTLQLSALGTFTDGTTQNVTAQLAWSSGAPPVASVSGTGLVTGLAPGTATITAAHSAWATASTTVTVLPSVPTLASLAPATIQVAAGALATFTLTLTEAQTQDTVVSIASSAPTIAALPAGGTVTILAGQTTQTVSVSGVAPGAATIAATLYSRTLHSQVSVTTAPPTVVSLFPAVLGLAVGGGEECTVTLSAAQPSAVAVTITTGEPEVLGFTGLTGGQVIVPANARTATFTVTGLQPPGTTVTATLNGSSVVAGAWVQQTLPTLHMVTCPAAVAVGATGRCTLSLNATQPVAVGIPVAATDPTVVGVATTVQVPANSRTATFAMTGLAVGSAEIVAGPLTETTQRAMIAVVTPAPTLAALDPNAIAVAPGATTILTVTVNAVQPTATTIPVSLHGVELVLRPIGITVPAGELTTAVPLTGLTVGTATLTVGPLNGTQRQAPVTVSAAPPTLVALTPAPASMPDWWAAPLTVRLSPVQVAPTVVPLATDDPWAGVLSVPPTVTIPAGASEAMFPVLTSYHTGTATVTAGPLNGSTAQTTVSVVGAETTSFAIVPAAATIPQGANQTFALLHAYSHGIVQDATPWSTWTSSSPAVAQVVAKGRVTGLASGTATITARISDINRSATAPVTVTTPVLTGLTLAPLVPHCLVAAAVPFQVTGTYSDGTTQDLTGGVTWTSSQGTVATITSPGGLATALTPGLTTISATHPDGLTVSTPLVVQRAATTLDAVVPTQGRIGTPVTLLGTNLGATSQVLFGGTAATFTVPSATRINTTVPGAAASGIITVVTPDGPALSPVGFTVVSPPIVGITSPPDGATIAGDQILVRGTITGGGADLGVSVNGIPAQVNDTQWAVAVPLQLGANPLTATATHGLGSPVTASVTVTATEAPPAPLLFRAVPDSGAVPLTVTWQVTNQTGRRLVQFELDAHGTGTFNPPMATFDGARTTYTTPGLRFPVLRATDDQGVQYTATTAINVLDGGKMATLLQEKWAGMKALLGQRDVEGALQSVGVGMRDRYRAAFDALGTDLPALAADMGGLQILSIDAEIAEAVTVRLEDGERRGYFIYFAPDDDGIWRILGM